jgi:hypothetical protein
MEQFGTELQACGPARGIFRANSMEAGTDLLGNWLVDVTDGRIGARGRRIRHVAANEQLACKIRQAVPATPTQAVRHRPPTVRAE